MATIVCVGRQQPGPNTHTATSLVAGSRLEIGAGASLLCARLRTMIDLCPLGHFWMAGAALLRRARNLLLMAPAVVGASAVVGWVAWPEAAGSVFLMLSVGLGAYFGAGWGIDYKQKRLIRDDPASEDEIPTGREE